MAFATACVVVVAPLPGTELDGAGDELGGADVVELAMDDGALVVGAPPTGAGAELLWVAFFECFAFVDAWWVAGALTTCAAELDR